MIKQLFIFKKKFILFEMLEIILILCHYTFLICFPSLADINVSHAIAMHGQPKYSKDFKHVEYVNPNAYKRWKSNF